MDFNIIPTSLLLALLIRAFWIVIFFGFIQHVLLKVVRKERLHDLIKFYNPLFRNVAWMLFAVYIIYRLAKINPVVSIAIVGVLIALGWKPIRNFVQGTIFKFQKGDIVGQRLKVKRYSGVVKRMDNTKLELSSKNGELIQIPYNKIVSEVTIKPVATKYLKTGRIIIDLPKGADLENSKNEYKRRLLNSPWVISHKGVKIEVSNHKKGKKQLKIAFSILNIAYVDRVRGAIEVSH